jgi:hypothetical protein
MLLFEEFQVFVAYLGRFTCGLRRRFRLRLQRQLLILRHGPVLLSPALQIKPLERFYAYLTRIGRPHMAARQVCAQGVITMYRGKPEMVLHSAEALKAK